jgi:Tfp pilus assembly protein PilF
MKKSVMLVMFVIVLTAVAADEKPKYQLSEVQTLKLQVKQKDAQLAQRDLSQAQQNFTKALQALSDEANQVKVENKWDVGVVFNPDTLSFADPVEVKK